MNDWTDITRESYNKIAKEYTLRRSQNLLWNAYSFILRNLFLFRLPKRKRVLVIGSAGGDLAITMAKKNISVDGVDFSKEMVKIATEKARHLNNCSFRVGDIRRVKLSRQYDGIFCDGILYHIPKEDLPAVITKLKNHLRKEGILYAIFKKGKGSELQQNPASFKGAPRAYWFYQPKELRKLFSDFSTLSVKKTNLTLFGEKYIHVWAKK